MKRKVLAAGWVCIWVAGLMYMRYGKELFSTANIVEFGSILVCAVGLGLMVPHLRLFNDKTDKGIFFVVWGLVFLTFLLPYIAFFPGILGYDTPIQLSMYMGELELTAANPLLHTYVLGGMISLGKYIFGSYKVGFALFVGLQVVLASNCMAQIFMFLKERRVPILISIVGTLWVAWNPVIQVLSCNATKDVLFGIFFTDFILAFMNLLDREDGRKRDIFRMILTGVLMCMFRNALIFLVMLLAVMSLFYCLHKKNRNKLMLGFVGIIGIVEAAALVSAGPLGIPGGELHEALSVPIQQLAGAAHYTYEYQQMQNPQEEAPVAISREELEAIQELLPDREVLEQSFHPYSVDGVKAIFQDDVFLSDKSRFIEVYLSLAKKNPGLYVYCWRDLISPYFDMGSNLSRYLAYEYTFPGLHLDEKYGIYFDGKYLTNYRSYLEQTVGKEYDGYMPFVWEPIVTLYLLGLLVGRAILQKEGNILLGVVPILFYFVGLLLGPVALLRYTYPFMLTTPLLLGLLFRQDKNVLAI